MAEQKENEQEQTVHEFAAAYWDLWIAPLVIQKNQAPTQTKKKKLQSEIERLLIARGAEIKKRYGKMP